MQVLICKYLHLVTIHAGENVEVAKWMLETRGGSVITGSSQAELRGCGGILEELLCVHLPTCLPICLPIWRHTKFWIH